MALAALPDQCRTCSSKPLPGGADVRDAWKAVVCEIVSKLWPGHYRELVDDARSRARTPKKDHELMGVSDACDAVGIGVHVLVTSR